eukprot:712091-Prorocentrum_minimum.AAC.1
MASTVTDCMGKVAGMGGGVTVRTSINLSARCSHTHMASTVMDCMGGIACMGGSCLYGGG